MFIKDILYYEFVAANAAFLFPHQNNTCSTSFETAHLGESPLAHNKMVQRK
jgi:hypothetical protein